MISLMSTEAVEVKPPSNPKVQIATQSIRESDEFKTELGVMD